MQCEDNSKLRIPLSEVCQTTDIGCVPITDGKPTCSPQPDELPFAFDPKTTTLWIFSCKTREWLDFTKFNVCQLDALNLDNITNICDILNIAVNYSGSGECKQGTITLAELAERILECLKLETKIITIGEGEGNKVKITIEGLPLDSVYVTGVNIWSEGGSGTEADPLVVATYDPICKWPIKTQAQVDAANTKHLGACLDGEMSRVPFPPKVCELPSRNQAQVDAAGNKELIACVDGEGVKIPYPSSPCAYPQLTPEQVERAFDKDIIACVDGRNVKIPVPGNLYEESVCASDQITLEQAKQKGNNLTIVGCDTNKVVRIPVSGSGFFDRDYICVPSVTAKPSGAPLEGTGPFRIGCNGELYVWICESDAGGRWEEVRFNPNSLDSLNPSSVANLCENFRLMGWYSNTSGDPCVEQVKFTLKQLAGMILTCFESDQGFRTRISEMVLEYIQDNKECEEPFRSDFIDNYPWNYSGRVLDLEKVSLVSPSPHSYYGNNVAIYNLRRHSWDYGSGSFSHTWDRDTYPDAGQAIVTVYNDPVVNKGCAIWYYINTTCQLIQYGHTDYDKTYSAAVIAKLSESPSLAWDDFVCDGDGDRCWSAPPRSTAVAYWHTNMAGSQGIWQYGNGKGELLMRTDGVSLRDISGKLNPGESVTYYFHVFVVITSRESTIDYSGGDGRKVLYGLGSYANIRTYRGLII